jgi:tetratricopeptide (TPR) repeat protein
MNVLGCLSKFAEIYQGPEPDDYRLEQKEKDARVRDGKRMLLELKKLSHAWPILADDLHYYIAEAAWVAGDVKTAVQSAKDEIRVKGVNQAEAQRLLGRIALAEATRRYLRTQADGPNQEGGDTFDRESAKIIKSKQEAEIKAYPDGFEEDQESGTYQTGSVTNVVRLKTDGKLTEIAKISASIGDYDEAVKAWKHVLGLFRNDEWISYSAADCWAQFGDCHFAAGKWAEAIGHYYKAAACGARNRRELAGKIAAAREKAARGEKTPVAASQPAERAESYARIANLYADTELFKDAEAAAEKAVKLGGAGYEKTFRGIWTRELEMAERLLDTGLAGRVVRGVRIEKATIESLKKRLGRL